MNEHDCFENWWARPIEELAANEHNGFAVLALSFPIVERYLREKSRTGEGSLGPPFYAELGVLLPELDASRLQSFWHAYRNGLLHQATFSTRKRDGQSVPSSWIKPGQDVVVGYDAAENCFCVNARLFAERVLSRIRADFETFKGVSSANHPVPVVEATPADANPGARSGVYS